MKICGCWFLIQAMAELLAENYYNIWAKKRKIELESKGESGNLAKQKQQMLKI